MESNIRIQSGVMLDVFKKILVKYGFTESKALKCAEIFMKNSLEGVYSHGVNRFPRFVGNVRDGYVKPDAVPVLLSAKGGIEQWDGMLGPGPLNAIFATERAMTMAVENGISLVTLARTNHWMRAGAYGWHAARKGFILIAWTNTEANMPAWGAKDARLGNNPMLLAVPYGDKAVVLDFAMTQFAYGKMETYKIAGKQLPFPGGYNDRGELTTDPAPILETRRALPIGFWKGSGLSFMLDLLAAVLSGGDSTSEITKRGTEYSLSQVFIVINPAVTDSGGRMGETIGRVIADLKTSIPDGSTSSIRYPGENIGTIRNENLANGIPVSIEVWESVNRLL
ncbi:MAG: 3-dehydro-L-gulonate 2-dehydrogenase [Bacteroidales bacterium]